MSRNLSRWWWALPALLLLAGLARVRFDTDVLNLLPDSVPAVRGLQLYQRHFTNSRELIATIRAPDAEAAETAARMLAEAWRRETNLVASVVWQPPWLEHPEQMAEFIAYLWLNQPPAALAEMTNRLAPDKLATIARESREQLATSMSPEEVARLSYDPFGLTRLPETTQGDVLMRSPQEGFASGDGSFRAVFIESRPELPNYRACARWLADVRDVAERAARSPGWPRGVSVRYTGTPAFVAEIATSMAADMQLTVLSTLLVIAGLFWWAHRSWRPLLWLVAMLALVMAGALAACGLVFGTLNAVSLGFGAILAGLAVDYGLVVYEEAAAHPERSPAEVRRPLVPALTWSALTTAAAFLVLNFADLPGLSELGTLVGVGMLLTPVVMLFVFLPIIARKLQPRRRGADTPALAEQRTSGHRALRFASAITALAALVVIWRAGIRVERGNAALEPRHIAANQTLNELNAELNRQRDPLLLVVSGASEGEVASRLDAASSGLAKARERGGKFTSALPNAVWPHPDWQRTNRVTAAALATQAPALRAAADSAGFTTDAMGLTESLLRSWRADASSSANLWPTNEACRWLLKRAVARSGTNWLAAGAVFAESDAAPRLAEKLDPHLPGVWLTGWTLLGERLADHVERRIVWVVLAIVLVVGTCLWLAFGRWPEVLIGLGALAFTLAVLQAVMSAAGLAWNLMSLAAVPLLLGAGVDYSIHIQLALRRHGGDLRTVRRITGRALFLCAATTVAGFGSNVFSSNPGLASLGLVCAFGIATAYVTAAFLVPAWWTLWNTGAASSASFAERLARPSAAYGPRVWRLGLLLVRCVPRSLCQVLGQMLALGYRWFRPQRFGILVENLLPMLNGDPAAARRAARSLMTNFAVKLTDLLRHEGGSSREIAVTRWSGYEILRAALERKQGVLLVTPHLGNWEFGGCLLAQQGVRLLVLTQAEPGAGFTEMRQQARARWGIETLVVGQDAFAFVEIIKRLQEGAVVALLVDRPPPPSGVTVEFFGRPFQASIAPAELARASGCAVVPVYVVAEGGGYSAHVLPEVVYDRRALGNRETRRQFAGEILRAFEPVVRQYADQWYHFVPMWRSDAAGK